MSDADPSSSGSKAPRKVKMKNAGDASDSDSESDGSNKASLKPPVAPLDVNESGGESEDEWPGSREPSAEALGLAAARTSSRTIERALTQRVATTGDMVMVAETGDILDKYELGPQLGKSGGFGAAFLATERATGKQFAVKVLKKWPTRMAKARERLDMFRREVTMLKEQPKHENLLGFREVFETNERLYIVTELCSGGELYDKIAAGKRFSEAEASHIVRQILAGVAVMHANNMAHCDLKPDNILFLSKDADAPLKIIDFGMARLWSPRELAYFTGVAGTPYYQSPEVVKQRFHLSCDSWSIGVITFILLYGYAPFDGRGNHRRTRRLILRGFNPVVQRGAGPWFNSGIPVSESARDFIKQLLILDPARRMTVQEALNHSWIQGPPEDSAVSPSVLESLRHFSAFTQFQQRILQLMVSHITPDEMTRLKTTFKAIDTDGDGKLSPAELQSALGDVEFTDEQHMEPNEVEALFSSVDVNGDNEIDFDELVMAVAQQKLVATEERLNKLFRGFDEDADNKITAQELANTLNVPLEEAQEYVASIDKDGDGMMDYDEFLAMWRSNNTHF